MAAIGSLIFCTDCGNLLPASKGSEKNILHCECCGAENRGVCQRRLSEETSDQVRILARSDTETNQNRYRVQDHSNKDQTLRFPFTPAAKAVYDADSREA